MVLESEFSDEPLSFSLENYVQFFFFLRNGCQLPGRQAADYNLSNKNCEMSLS